jgi:hypothetical protein
MTNSEAVQGWAEILHFKYDFKQLHLAVPEIQSTTTLTHFNEEHYEMVGSTLPLCEYASAFEMYEQFAGTIDSEFGIVRGFKAGDAINICTNDPDIGRKITTLFLWPREQHYNLQYRTQNVQYSSKLPLCLVQRKEAFSSFVLQKNKNE